MSPTTEQGGTTAMPWNTPSRSWAEAEHQAAGRGTTTTVDESLIATATTPFAFSSPSASSLSEQA
jgi:hypothetical protein